MALASIAGAQGYGATEVRRELERTNEVIRRAAEIVQAAPAPRAVDLLENAVRLQENAWGRFRGAQYGMALTETREARNLAFRAVDVARNRLAPGSGPLDLEPRAQRMIENSQRAFDRARECAGDPPPPAAQRVLELAASRLEDAQQAFRDRKYDLAVEIAGQVGRLLDDVCTGPRRENVEQLLDNVERLLERATPAVIEAGNPNAVNLLEQARALVPRAREHLAARNQQLAGQHARQARELVLQALRLSEMPPDPQSVAQLLEDASRDLEAAAEAVRSAANPEAGELMDRALDHLARAHDMRSQNRSRAALAELRVARNLAWRAARLAGIAAP
jgi:HEPN domain-containing protein